MGGSDRGGLVALQAVIKKSKVPIICICNDRQSPKIRALANNCFDLKVRRPTKTQIAQRLMEISRKEGLVMEQNAAEVLAEQVGNDIRQVINASQMWRAMSTTMKYMDLKENMGRIEKDKVLRQSPFDACMQILGGPPKTSFNDRYDSFFIDYSLVPLLVQENYIDAGKGSGYIRGLPEGDRMEKLSMAADAVSDMDIVGPGRMGSDMHWDLLPVQAAFSVRVGSLLQGFQAFPAFPKWLGKNSTTGKTKRLTQELCFHTMENIGVGFGTMRQTYVPYMTTLLLAPLLARGSDGVPEVLHMLQSYGLSKDDLMENLRELAFTVDKDVQLRGSCVCMPISLLHC
jgi:replication factor C subunit 1